MTRDNILRLLSLIGVDDPLVGNNGWITVRCPFAKRTHRKGTDNNPSMGLKINDDGRSGFSCFSCHTTGGSLTKFVRMIYAERGDIRGALSMPGIAETLETEFHLLDYEEGMLTDSAADTLDPQMMAAMFPLATEVTAASAYLTNRGVTTEASLLLDLRYDPDYNRIVFPVMDSRRSLFGYVGRSIDKNARLSHFTYPPLKKDRHLLGAHLFRDKMPKIVVEGQFAVARLVSIGVRKFADVCGIMGSAMSEAQASHLVSTGCPIVMMLDRDKAGDIGTTKALPLLEEALVGVPPYPTEAMGDPDYLMLGEVKEMVEYSLANPV